MPATTPQTPAPGQVFLDHIGWMVPDLDQISRAFERLGFRLTPFSVHGDRDPATGALKPIGTANRLVMLERGYLEFLALHGGVTNPSVERMKASIARHVGVHLCALTVHDAAKEAERLKTAGFTLNPTINLRRTIEAENGSQVEVSFTVIRPEAMPEGRVQMLTQHTPEHMWQSRYVKNDNAIAALRGLMFVVDDPVEVAGRLGRFANRPVEQRRDHLMVRLDRGHLRVFTQSAAKAYLNGASIPASPAMAAAGFASRDLAATRAFLKRAGITPFEDTGERLIIDAKDAMGCHMVVHQA